MSHKATLVVLRKTNLIKWSCPMKFITRYHCMDQCIMILVLIVPSQNALNEDDSVRT